MKTETQIRDRIKFLQENMQKKWTEIQKLKFFESQHTEEAEEMNNKIIVKNVNEIFILQWVLGE